MADRVSSSGPCHRAQESQSWHWPAGGQGQGPGNAGCRVELVLGLGSLGDKTCPRASTSPLLGRAGSWDLRLQSPGSWSLNWSAGGQGQCPGCPQAHISSLGYGEGVKLGLLLQVLGCPCASASFLVCGAESWPSSGQAHVPGCLWAQGVSRQLVEDSSGGGGVRPCLFSFLASGVPLLVLTGW